MTTLRQDTRFGFKTLAMLMLVPGMGAGLASAAPASPPSDVPSLFEEYRQKIPVRMQEEEVPGLAIAVVGDEGVLWVEGFGYTDRDRKTSVTPDTAFSIQSMSKSFTATAVLFAVQEGLVDLNAPISTYLPDFRVNSIFEEHPEQQMTLLMLVSHTAGFTHEAPVGSNYDLPCHSFEEHIASISNTWLRFPAGRRYAYSNLGIDMAGYVLQVRSAESFPQYVKDKVLTRLGMKDSTLDIAELRGMRNRAIGHTGIPLRLPVGWLIIPSGGVWTTAHDMARYLRFHINRGELDGTRILREDLAETMYAPPNEAARQAAYALGIAVSSKHGARRFQHGGGGFGFNSNMVWYPELRIGAVVLTNKVHRRLNSELADEILDRIIAREPNLYAERAKATPIPQPAPNPSPEKTVLSDAMLGDLIEGHAVPTDEVSLRRRKGYAGRYVSTCMGLPSNVTEIKQSRGDLFYGSQRMVEARAGLFFSPEGEALDLHGPSPSFRNIPLVKVNERILPWRIAFYVVCGLIFLSALLSWPAQALMRHIRRTSDDRILAPGRALRLAAFTAALASLLGLIVLVLFVEVSNLIHIPRPVPYRDLQWWAVAIMGLPYAGLVLAVCAGLLTGLAWRNRSGLYAVRIYYIVVSMALLAFNLVVLK